MKNLIMIGLCIGLVGCASEPRLVEKPFAEPQFGMTKRQMTDLLGKPDSIELYRKTDKTLVEFYIYHKNYRSSQESVPVCLIDNKVAGWGKTFYEDHMSTDDTRLK